MPFGAIAGCAENSALLLFVTMKFSVWPALVRRPGADRRRPAGDGLRARVLEHRLIGALQ